MGREPLLFEWEKVETLLASGCTIEQAALSVGLTYSQLKTKVEKEKRISITEYADIQKQCGDFCLLRKQFELAMKGCVPMLIWLGKQRLGQADKPKEKAEFNGSLATLLASIKMFKNSGDFDLFIKKLHEHKKKEELKATDRMLIEHEAIVNGTKSPKSRKKTTKKAKN